MDDVLIIAENIVVPVVCLDGIVSDCQTCKVTQYCSDGGISQAAVHIVCYLL